MIRRAILAAMVIAPAIIIFNIAAAAADTGGEYISWHIEEQRWSSWRTLSNFLMDSRSEPHNELLNIFTGTDCSARQAAENDGVKKFGGKRPITETSCAARQFISNSYRVYPSDNAAYRVAIENLTDCRMAVTAEIDGKNSIDSTDVSGTGADAAWVLPPHSKIYVKGFQSGYSSAMQFYWTDPRNAYSDRRERMGTIRLFVYFEQGQCARDTLAEYDRGGGVSPLSRSGADRATGAGNEVANPVRAVSFNRITQLPVEVVKIVYASGVSTGATWLSDLGKITHPPYYNPAPGRSCFNGIGVFVTDNYSFSGILVSDVIYPSPAWQAGIDAGDKIIKADGKLVSRVSDLKNIISSKRIGDFVEIEFIEAGRQNSSFIRIESVCYDNS